MSEQVKFSLAENALDFLLSAVAYVKVKDEHERSIKYTVLHLCDGIELLLKCRLNSEHWSLVLANMDRTSLEDLESGDFISVDWHNAISRVEKVTGEKFSSEERTLLGHLRRLRNRIQHFDVDVPQNVAVSLLAQGLHFATGFVEKHLLGGEGFEEAQESLHEIRRDLAEFHEFVKCRMGTLADKVAEIEKWSRVVPCPMCRQHALGADAEVATCLFCGYSEDGESAAAEWVLEFTGIRHKELSATDAISNCPECSCWSCVQLGLWEGEGGDEYFCFSCGGVGRYDTCCACGGLFAPANGEATCGDCFRQMMEGD